MIDTQDKPGIEERHVTATNTSDMTVDVSRRNGQADVILAAGLAAGGNRLGHDLMHLMAEWDRCDKPAKKSPAEIARRAAEIPDKKGRPDLRRATVEAMVEHAGAMRERARRLTGRSVVMGRLEDWAALRGIDRDLLSPALFHWLAPNCPACDGTGKKAALYGQSTGGESCTHCGGSRKWPRPPGAQVVHDYIKSCLGKFAGDTSRALYG